MKRANPLRLKRIALVTAGLLVGLGVVELSLRFLHFTDRSVFYVYDRERAIALRPFAEGWWLEEGGNYQRINSQGLHDREHQFNKPAGTLRIAVLGDSYAEALQVPITDAFWAVAESRLQRCPNLAGRQVELINFGVSGYGTAQELITLRSKVWAYSPDMVLLAFTTGNDFQDNYERLSSDPMRPYFVFRDGSLVQDRSALAAREASWTFRVLDSPAGRALVALKSHLRILQLVNSVIRTTRNSQARSARNLFQIERNQLQPRPTPEPGTSRMMYKEPVNEDWKEAWRVTEALISQMRDEVNRRGARFSVVTLSGAVQVSPQKADTEAEAASLGVKDLLYPERRIRSFGEANDIPVLNLAPELQQYAQNHNVYLHGFGKTQGTGHWNQAGHRVAGELVADWICGMIK